MNRIISRISRSTFARPVTAQQLLRPLPRYLSTKPSPSIDPISSSHDASSAISAATIRDATSPLQPPIAGEAGTPLHTISEAGVSAVSTTNAAVESAANAVETASAAAQATSFSDTLLQPAIALLTTMHDITGLPWYLSIAASTLVIRSLLLPATLFTMKNSARMQAIQPDIQEKREYVMEAVRMGNKQLMQDRQLEMQQFMKGAGVSPAKVLVGPLAQLPVFISFFVGIRRLAEADPTFATGGIGWFTDLSSMDPIYVLPVLCGASLLGMTEFGGDTGSTKMTPQMKMVMRGIAFLSVPLTYWFPAAVFCYWIPNNFFSMSLGATLRSQGTKRVLGLKIDPATIPGTRKFKELHATLGVGVRSGAGQPVDTSQAVASYIKNSSSGRSGSSGNVKPVLLKHRPPRKAKASGD